MTTDEIRQKDITETEERSDAEQIDDLELSDFAAKEISGGRRGCGHMCEDVTTRPILNHNEVLATS